MTPASTPDLGTTPFDECDDDRPEPPPRLGQAILEAPAGIASASLLDEPGLLESSEPPGEDVRGDPLPRLEELAVAFPARRRGRGDRRGATLLARRPNGGVSG